MKVLSLFSGVGGIDLAFQNAGFDIILANEIDLNASKTYAMNFKNKLINDDINNLDYNNLPDFDCLIAGFPCQAFSIAGYRKGFSDKRGILFFNIAEIIKIKKPEIIFLENVKNLVSHDNGNTFKKIKEILSEEGYYIHYKILNACEYGNIPQNRERIYIVGFLNKKHYDKFNWISKIKLETKLNKLIDYEKELDQKFYYTKDKYPRIFNEFEKISSNNNIYQWRRKYVRENKNSLCPTLTANMGTGGHNVPIIFSKNGLRKITPRECFLLQGFPKQFKLPNLSQSHLYKQAGNSVCVSVVERIAKEIMRVIKN